MAISKHVFSSSSNFQAIVNRPPPFVPKFSFDVSSFAMDLPYEKLSIFARRYESSDVLVQMPVFVIAELGVIADEDGPAAPPANPPDDGSTTGDNPPKDPPIIRLRSLRDEATSARPPRKPKVHVPLGMLCTDHTGYAAKPWSRPCIARMWCHSPHRCKSPGTAGSRSSAGREARKAM